MKAQTPTMLLIMVGIVVVVVVMVLVLSGVLPNFIERATDIGAQMGCTITRQC